MWDVKKHEARFSLGTRPCLLPRSLVPVEARSHFKCIALNMQRLPIAIWWNMWKQLKSEWKTVRQQQLIFPTDSKNTEPQQWGNPQGKGFFFLVFYSKHTTIVWLSLVLFSFLLPFCCCLVNPCLIRIRLEMKDVRCMQNLLLTYLSSARNLRPLTIWTLSRLGSCPNTEGINHIRNLNSLLNWLKHGRVLLCDIKTGPNGKNLLCINISIPSYDPSPFSS